MSKKLIATLLSFIFSLTIIHAKEFTVTGKVTDSRGAPIEFANITVPYTGVGTITDSSGHYTLQFESDSAVSVCASFTGYKKETKRITSSGTFNFKLSTSFTELSEVRVANQREREVSQIRLNPKMLESLPGTSLGGIETSLKTLPGVTSNSELSNQYNVRGGNYDENLIYINSVKVQRPILVRNGKQEGMSTVNPDLVSSLSFSSGGFDASYGDKMSSVLDISYKKPKALEAGFSANLLGASAYFDACNKSKKLSATTGFRYRNTALLLNSLEDEGKYEPTFFDVQSYITQKINDKLESNFYIYGSSNTYIFTPIKRSTKFRQGTQYYNMDIYFDGKENDSYQSAIIAGNLVYKPSKNLKIRTGYSHYSSNEKEIFDIDAEYLINNADEDTGIKTADGVQEAEEALAAGSYLSHARNYLFIETHRPDMEMSYTLENFQAKGGITLQHDIFDSHVNEWQYIDSAEYSFPYSDSYITLNEFKSHDTILINNEVSAYAQVRKRMYWGGNTISVTAGVRYIYTQLTNENLFAPRGRISLKPDWKQDFVFRLSGGVYHQTPWFKEYLENDGSFNTNIESQKSLQMVFGTDYNLLIWQRPFRLMVEAYYKHFSNIIPYDVDNVRIQYYPSEHATGYAQGLDFKLNGEFVPGTESWISASLLETKENIAGDDIGFVRRPTDRLLNFGMFFQDFLPRNDSYKMNLTMYYGTALPTKPPGAGRESLDIFSLPDYQRVDIGFLKQIFPNKKGKSAAKLKSLWVGIEVFNLLDKSNTISYLWIKDIYGKDWPVPNYLTRRQLNVSLSGKF